MGWMEEKVVGLAHGYLRDGAERERECVAHTQHVPKATRECDNHRDTSVYPSTPAEDFVFEFCPK